jgi:hypothetical protein
MEAARFPETPEETIILHSAKRHTTIMWATAVLKTRKLT